MVSRRDILKGLYNGGKVVGSAYLVKKGYDIGSDNPLTRTAATIAEESIRFAETVKTAGNTIANLLGFGNYDISEFQKVVDSYDQKEVHSGLSEFETKVRDTYKTVVQYDNAFNKNVSGLDKTKRELSEALQTTRDALGRIGQKGHEMKSEDFKRKIDGPIMKYDPLNRLGHALFRREEEEKHNAPTTNPGAVDQATLQNRLERLHTITREYEKAHKALREVVDNYKSLIMHLHKEYVINNNKSAGERAGALDVMADAALHHQTAVEVMYKLVQEGRYDLPKYQGHLDTITNAHERVMNIAETRYNFEREGTLADEARTVVQYIGGGIGAVLAGIGAYLGNKLLKLFEVPAGLASRAYDRRQSRREFLSGGRSESPLSEEQPSINQPIVAGNEGGTSAEPNHQPPTDTRKRGPDPTN